MNKKRISFELWWPENIKIWRFAKKYLMPHPGTLVFVLLLVAVTGVWAKSSVLSPLNAGTSTGTIAYQGRLADTGGTPLTNTYNMIFRLYNTSTGGTPLWEEQWTGSNSVKVSDGLFNVMLGSLTPIPQNIITGNDTLYLGITVGTDNEMSPRVQLGSVPFAVQALTVPDGSITGAKIATGAITTTQLASGIIVPFGGRQNSYPYITHLRHFGLNNGNSCFGYVPGDPGVVGAHPLCVSLDRFLAGVKVYSPSGNGYVGSANNFPYDSNGTKHARWGYSFSFFLNNSGSARSMTLPLSSCNDVALYVTTGSTDSDRLGDTYNLVYHRYPGNNDPNLTTCTCADLNPAINIPTGPFRLTAVTRGGDCTSYINIGTIDAAGLPTGNWITANNLAIDWTNMRTYLGEQ